MTRRRDLRRLGLRALSAFVLGLAGGATEGCHEHDPHCHGRTCLCRDETFCDFDCPTNGCDVVCESLSECFGGCGDACAFTCRDASGCDLECGDACEAVCERVSSCNIDCGENCDVICRDLSSCSVRMISGSVLCERVGGCDVACLGSDGGSTAAEDCGNGRFACGGC